MTIMRTKSTLVVIWKLIKQIIKFQTSSTLYNIYNIKNRKNKQHSEKRNFETIKHTLEENLKKYNNKQ